MQFLFLTISLCFFCETWQNKGVAFSNPDEPEPERPIAESQNEELDATFVY
jgi:hypothetical protein